MDILKLFATPRASFAINLLMCAVCLVWTLGMDANRRDTASAKGWVTFWAATAASYAVLLVWPADWRTEATWWIPFVGFYVASVALLAPCLRRWAPAGTRAAGHPVATATTIVSTIVAADLITYVATHRWSENGQPVTGWHQGLTAIVFAAWAWQLRQRSTGKSIVLLTYALTQLPVSLLTLLPDMKEPTYSAVVAASFATYAFLKLGLIEPIYAVCERQNATSGSIPSTGSSNGRAS